MYIICKECKKKLSGNSSYSLDELDRYYTKLKPSILWGCIDSPIILLDGSKMPWSNHIVDNEDLKEFIIKNGA